MGTDHMYWQYNTNFMDNLMESYFVSLNWISALFDVEDRRDMSLSEYELDCLLLSSIWYKCLWLY